MAHREDSRHPVEFLPYESIAACHQQPHRECPICMMEYTPQTLIPFGLCGHQFCRGCLSSHLSFSLNRYNLPKCPRQLCSEELSTDSEGYQLLNENQRQRYKKIVSYLFIIKNPSYLPCQRENCTGLIDKGEGTWRCQLCGEKLCADCYQLQHGGECGVRIAMEFETRSKFRQCKQCGQMIEKTEGCTHMSCTCGHYFCYSCGETLTNGDHKCIPPAELNLIESVRWSIEHEQFWYQFGDISFLSYLLLVSPPRGSSVASQVIWAYIYLIIFYPISLVLFTVFAVIAFLITCLLFFIFTVILPFTPLFTDDAPQLWFSPTVQEHFGPIIGLLLILMFYPILYFVHIAQIMMMFLEEEDFSFEMACIIPIQLIKGWRNMALMPCLMLIDNQRYYLALGRLRQASLLNQQ